MLLGIDIGTSACKIALFEIDGSVVASVSKSYKTFYPKSGWAEQDPADWWDAVCLGIRQMLQITGFNPGQISGIGVDGQSWSAIPVDQDGNCLARTPIWMDTRARYICDEMEWKLDKERIFAVAGNALRPSYSTPKIVWLRREYPEIYKHTYKFLQSNSYIVMKLTGEMSQDYSQGYGLHFFHNTNLAYDENMAEDFGIELDKLPGLYSCHSVVGGLTSLAAKECGLKAGTPVVAGGLDAACGTLGAGIYDNGQTQEQGGQAGGMSICTEIAAAHPQLISGAHVVSGKWLLQGGTVGGGGVLQWIRQELWEDMSFDSLTGLAGEVAAGSEGVRFLPYMAGERSPIWNPDAKGVFFGLGYDKTKGHMLRAAMEGVAFSLEHNLRVAAETGVHVDSLISMGGSAKSHLWTQIKADVTGKVIEVSASDTATTLGAAILAGVGTGVYEDFKDAVNRTNKITRIHTPDAKTHEIYQDAMEHYLRLYESLKHMFIPEKTT